MKHEVVAFDRDTEREAFSIDLPGENLEQLTALMGWQEPDDPIYEYELSDEQIAALEKLIGRHFHSPDYLFFLSCSV
ncbi:DUF7683 domain-containing protein [Pseudomonas chlororaphis]|uniref:DUF7683 domain-containing protein n=1 Tax=Pseudomonas chlororaphis TaxID=587753 RepID=UPI0014764A6C|nr:hypothetical protein [Pseudomonas chlororaphis]NNB47066.1 hypothetical protein [Pseudomonas chlororaphis]